MCYLIMYYLLCRKIVELEEELRVVGNNLKSLEVSEEKVHVYYSVKLVLHYSFLENNSFEIKIIYSQNFSNRNYNSIFSVPTQLINNVL